MPAEATIERYRNAAIALLPPGRAISKDVYSDVAALLEACAVEWARHHEDSEALHTAIVPGESADYLDLWEQTLGLPSECVTNPPTDIESRLAAVRLHILGLSNHSELAFQAAATGLGFGAIAVIRYVPAICTDECTAPLYDDTWANVITVLVTGTESETLNCIFRDQLRRAHAFIEVRYV